MTDVVVRGAVSPEELAAVVAALTRRRPAARAVGGYERWRRGRLQALTRGVISDRVDEHGRCG